MQGVSSFSWHFLIDLGQVPQLNLTLGVLACKAFFPSNPVRLMMFPIQTRKDVVYQRL